MKCTLNIDRDLLDRVVAITGAATKTDAIHFALREVDRRARLVERLREGTGLEAKRLGDLFAASDEAEAMVGQVEVEGAAESNHLRVAEAPMPYGARRGRLDP